MRILIQHVETGLYVSGCLWTDDATKATEFPTAEQAEEFYRRHQLRDAAVVFRFKSGEADTRFLAGPASKAILSAPAPAKSWSASPARSAPGFWRRVARWWRGRRSKD